MRHRKRGRKLGRNASHRKAMFRNMACSLIRSARIYTDDSDNPEPGSPKVPGRIVTTLPKAKELRPRVEKLITLAKRALAHEERADEFATDAERNTSEWKAWRESDRWQKWNQAVAPAVALRRRAFAELRDHEAVDVLFTELAERFEERPGGYTRVVRLAEVRLGDAGQQAIIEFVGNNDRISTKTKSSSAPAPVVTEDDEEDEQSTDAATESVPDDGASAVEQETEQDPTAEPDQIRDTEPTGQVPPGQDSPEEEGKKAEEQQ